MFRWWWSLSWCASTLPLMGPFWTGGQFCKRASGDVRRDSWTASPKHVRHQFPKKKTKRNMPIATTSFRCVVRPAMTRFSLRSAWTYSAETNTTEMPESRLTICAKRLTVCCGVELSNATDDVCIISSALLCCISFIAMRAVRSH